MRRTFLRGAAVITERDGKRDKRGRMSTHFLLAQLADNAELP
jgi:hypothetical protein